MIKIVITGASGTGKTKLLNTLKDRGYKVSPEVAREVHKEGFRAPYILQREMFIRQMDRERKQEGLIIYDRGVPDILGFADYLDVSFPFVIGFYYHVVLCLDYVSYETDYRNRVEKGPKHARYIFKHYILPYYKQQYPAPPDIYSIKKRDSLKKVIDIIDSYSEEC